jgi:hypothetical protein
VHGVLGAGGFRAADHTPAALAIIGLFRRHQRSFGFNNYKPFKLSGNIQMGGQTAKTA